jgi:hypothetical protein
MTSHSEDIGEFLYASIEDVQGTIRAIDTKMAALMVILIIPLSQLGDIVQKIRGLLAQTQNSMQPAVWVLSAVCIVSWLLSIVVTLLALLGIDSPFAHVRFGGETENPKGAFYAGNVFTFEPKHVFNPAEIRSSRTLLDHVADLPASHDALVKELAFEQMKLAYVRGLKMIRQKYAFLCALVWLCTGGAIWFWATAVLPSK